MPFKYLLIYLVVLNLAAYFAYFRDKQLAKTNRFRISEATLLLLAFLGGPLGAQLAMNRFRHKTQHLKFKLLVPFFLVFWAGLIIIGIKRGILKL